MPDLYVAPSGKPKENKPKEVKREKGEEISSQGGVLSAFVARPAGVHFAALERGEQIVLLLRKHWVTNLPWIFISFLMLVSPLVLRLFPLLEFLPGRFQIIAVIGWYLLAIGFIFERFLSWYFNVYIVTNKRVIDLDFYNLVYYNQAQADLSQITDMNLTICGTLGVVFNYGNLVIETAAEAPNLEFQAVPNPREVVKIIDSLR
jgi:hypothetical protein